MALAKPAQAQVAVGIGIGPEVGYPGYYDLGGPPVCEWGYYSYYPYACAPYGYWGPDWFYGGVFIGAGPWFHGWYGRPWGYGYGHIGYYGGLGTVVGTAYGGYRAGYGGFRGGYWRRWVSRRLCGWTIAVELAGGYHGYAGGYRGGYSGGVSRRSVSADSTADRWAAADFMAAEAVASTAAVVDTVMLGHRNTTRPAQPKGLLFGAGLRVLSA